MVQVIIHLLTLKLTSMGKTSGSISVPAQNGQLNNTIADAIGNKDDWAFSGNTSGKVSLHGHSKAGYYHVHSSAIALPAQKDSINVADNNGNPWEFGTGVTVIGYTLTLANAAVVDYSGTIAGTVKIQIDDHGYIAEDMDVVISGTINYDGTYEIVAVPDKDNIVITAAYVAETFAGTETAIATMNKLFDCHYVNISEVSAVDDYLLKLTYNDGTEKTFGTVAFSRSNNFAQEGNRPIQGSPMPAGSIVKAYLASGDGDTANCNVKLYLHTYPG
jgi:hypothetical protein